MNLQTLIVVVLRLMSLNFLLQVAIQLSPQVLRLSEEYPSLKEVDSRSLLVLSSLLIIGLVIGAVLLWLFALPIARLATRGVPHELSFGSLSLADCYSVAFIGMGLFYIANYLPQILNWTHYLFKTAASYPGNDWKGQVQWYSVSSVFIPFIVGVVLFVNGRRWAIMLARRQTEGSPPAKTVVETHETDT